MTLQSVRAAKLPTDNLQDDRLLIRRDCVAVLIPAHNEEQDITDTINSLRAMVRVPDLILVISDNSTDNTVQIARDMGVDVLETCGNTFKKAGALNVGLRQLIKDGTIPEFIVTMDADTIFHERFLSRGILMMRSNTNLGVLSAVCQGKTGLIKFPSWPISTALHARRTALWYVWQTLLFVCAFIAAGFNSWLTWFQRAEYARAGVLRIRSNIHTMSGAGSIIRAEAIQDLLDSQSESDYHHAKMYQERVDNLVEDFTLTLDIKELGWLCTNCEYAVAHTDLMRSLPALVRQRTRWVRGTIDELRRRKFSREARLSTWALIFGLCVMPFAYLWPALIVISVLQDSSSLSDYWLLLLVAMFQVYLTRSMGWKAMIIAFLLIPDMLYGVIRHYWVISSVIMSYRSKQQNWS